MVEARNVFDSDEEFMRLRGAVMAAIDEFAESRGGNVTYGEMIFVLEAVTDEFRQLCEDPASAEEPTSIDKMVHASQIRGVLTRILRLLAEKGIISIEEESQLVSGR